MARKPRSPGYPTLSKEERESASDFIREHMGHLEEHPGGPAQAIAIGLRQAAPDKYTSWSEKRAKRKAKS